MAQRGDRGDGSPGRSRGQTAGALSRPLLNQRIFAPYKIATLVETAAAHGLAAETVLARTGLTLADVGDPHALTSVRQYIAACDNALGAGLLPEAAYAVGSRLRLSAYGMYGYALMCSPTMRDFFDFAVRYHLLATPTLRLGWRQEGEVAVWELAEIYSDVLSIDLRRFLLRQQMMQIATHVRDVAGSGNAPLRALFALPQAGAGDADARLLGHPCLFGQAAHELHYPASILDQAPELGNRLTRTMLEETCDRLIGEARMTSGLSGEIYQILMLSPNRFPSMQTIAHKLGIGERTLRRRLDEENCSYADIVDDVRKKLALEYVQTTRMSADDIAWKVGFSDSTNLRRAIKRWTGKTLGELRHE